MVSVPEGNPQKQNCVRCVLPAGFPGIAFDSAGLCNYCRDFEDKMRKNNDPRSGRNIHKKKFLREFLRLAGELKNPDRPYDVLLAYSGGKDSTYTMHLLKNGYRLRPLAVTFDNGFLPEATRENIARLTRRLGVDHTIFKPNWGLLRRIFRASAKEDLYTRKSLERASTVCTSCMALVKAFCLKTAIEKGIPMIAYGWTPWQAPLQSSIFRNNAALAEAWQDAILKPMIKAVGCEVKSLFLDETYFSSAGSFPYNVHPMAWEPYDEGKILREIRKLGWIAPADTDPNSTNCLLNAFAVHSHLKRHGFHPYSWEVAGMVRAGVMSREQGLAKLAEPATAGQADYARRLLGEP